MVVVVVVVAGPNLAEPAGEAEPEPARLADEAGPRPGGKASGGREGGGGVGVAGI